MRIPNAPFFSYFEKYHLTQLKLSGTFRDETKLVGSIGVATKKTWWW